jgi:peptidyl-prolyl cis-trans isomerase C
VKKTTLTLMALALAATVASAQPKPAAAPPAAPAMAAPAVTAAPVAPAVAPDAVIIAAGPVSITRTDFEAAVKTLPEQYQQFALGQGRKQFAEDFLRLKLLAAEGKKNGLENDPEVLKQLGMVRENLVATAQLSRIEKSVTVSDADLKAAYDSNNKDYEQLHARHILIAFKGSPAAQAGKKELTEEEAKAKAEDIHKKLLAGAKFDELAKAESDDTGSGSTGGDLGTFGRGQMVPEFEAVAFATKPGEISPVVRTQFGYHIIKVESHDNTPFEQVKPRLEKDLHQKKVQDALDKIKGDAKPQFNEAYFAAPPSEPTPAPAVAPASAPAPKKP